MSAADVNLDLHGDVKPRLRGLIHAWAAVPVAIAGVVLVALTNPGRAQFSTAVYVVAITAMLTASACYHRAHVSNAARKLLRKVDHSMIGVAVAGTCTPVVVLILHGDAMWIMLAALWSGALGVMALTVAWPDAPNWVRAVAYAVLGWAGVLMAPLILSRGGVAVFALVAIGGVFYTIGAVIYATRKPNPWPVTFGFHEMFHVFVLLAVVAHFAAVTVLTARA